MRLGAAVFLTGVCVCALAQTPATTSSKSSETGKSAGVSGGAGAAGQGGTDPATLTRTEEQRVAKEKSQHGATNAKPAKNGDNRYGAGSN